MLTHARQLNPLNTDHSANLARFYKSWAVRVRTDMGIEGLTETEKASLNSQYETLLRQSLENYEIALTLSPNNPILWNELAQLYGLDYGDDAKFQETIDKSLEVDDEYEQTWMLLGDMYSTKGDLASAAEAYARSLEIKNNCTVRRVLGTLKAQQAELAKQEQQALDVQQTLWADATATLNTAIEKCPNYNELWDIYRVLSIAYANQGQGPQAFQTGAQALELAPEEQKPALQQLLDQVQQQFAPATQP